MEAAEAVLTASGDVSTVTVEAVARHAGVSTSAVYLHFASRSDLVYETVHGLWRRLIDEQLAAATQLDDALQRIGARGRVLIDFARDHPEAYRVLFMGRGTDVPERFRGPRLFDGSSFPGMIDDVVEAIGEGLVMDGDPIELSCVLWMGVHGFISLQLALPEFPWPPYDPLAALMLRSLDRGTAGPRHEEWGDAPGEREPGRRTSARRAAPPT